VDVFAKQNIEKCLDKTTTATMSNIHISPMAAPSLESLSAEAQRPAAEFSATNGNFKPVQKSDENMNEVFVGVTKSDTIWQSPNDHGKNEELEELQQKVWNKSPNVIMSKTITGKITYKRQYHFHFVQ